MTLVVRSGWDVARPATDRRGGFCCTDSSELEGAGIRRRMAPGGTAPAPVVSRYDSGLSADSRRGGAVIPCIPKALRHILARRSHTGRSGFGSKDSVETPRFEGVHSDGGDPECVLRDNWLDCTEPSAPLPGSFAVRTHVPGLRGHALTPCVLADEHQYVRLPAREATRREANALGEFALCSVKRIAALTTGLVSCRDKADDGEWKVRWADRGRARAATTCLTPSAAACQCPSIRHVQRDDDTNSRSAVRWACCGHRGERLTPIEEHL